MHFNHLISLILHSFLLNFLRGIGNGEHLLNSIINTRKRMEVFGKIRRDDECRKHIL